MSTALPTPAPTLAASTGTAAPALPAQLTHRQARQALAALQAQLRSNNGSDSTANGWVVDASALQVFDSSALAVLLECRRNALAAQQPFAVLGLPDALAGLAKLYGVAELLPAAA